MKQKSAKTVKFPLDTATLLKIAKVGAITLFFMWLWKIHPLVAVVEAMALYGALLCLKGIIDTTKQVDAYYMRNKIKVGDQFLWRRVRVGWTEYITSGKMQKMYFGSEEFPYENEGIFEVYKVQVEDQGNDAYVYYYLKVPGDDEENYVLIVDGASAMKMQRVTD